MFTIMYIYFNFTIINIFLLIVPTAISIKCVMSTRWIVKSALG